MARMRHERLDPARHRDYMRSRWIGGLPAQAPRDNLLPAWVYVVHGGSFTFEFHSIEQIQECLEYFRAKRNGARASQDMILSTTGSAGMSGCPQG